MKAIFSVFLVLSLCQASFSEAAAGSPETATGRTFHFNYSVEIPKEGISGNLPLDIFIPLAQSDKQQEIVKREIKTELEGQIAKEDKYGNLFWHTRIDKLPADALKIEVDYLVKRKVFTQELTEDLKVRSFTDEELKNEELFLGPNRRVPVAGERIRQVQADIPQTADYPLPRARAIYDYVVDNMEYKKVGTGWGNGDTFWACSEKYGNCTDFHALFISLARAEGIPAKFEIGFPIPEDAPSGTIGGYHCWVAFKLPTIGWTPLDASEAKKHPEKRELLFGSQPADRIKLTEGRDLVLGESHKGKPLNYFVYPYLESKSKEVKGAKLRTSYRE